MQRIRSEQVAERAFTDDRGQVIGTQAGVNAWVRARLTELGSQVVRIAVVASLPESGDAKTLYLVPVDGANLLQRLVGVKRNVYEEWLWVDDSWEKVGEDRLDLSGYAEKAEVETVAADLKALKESLRVDADEGDAVECVFLGAGSEKVRLFNTTTEWVESVEIDGMAAEVNSSYAVFGDEAEHVVKIVFADGNKWGEQRFAKCERLTSVTVPVGVRRLPDGCFGECARLERAVLPGVTVLGRSVFQKCVSLTEVLLNGAVRVVGVQAFVGCEALGEIELGEMAESIGEAAFSGCGLREFRMPRALKTIGPHAFDGCQKLARVEWNQELESLGGGAFAGCPIENTPVVPATLVYAGTPGAAEGGLTTLTTDDDTAPWGVFRKGQFEALVWQSVSPIPVLLCMGCRNLKRVLIAAGVTAVEQGAFRTTALTHIQLPATVEKVGKDAFPDGCVVEYV